MKTFETEKHNIPDGATHYRDGCEDFKFSWVMFDDGELMVDTIAIGWSRFKHPEFEAKVKPIPQTKEVGWVNGDDVEAYGKLYKYVGLDPFNDNLCICLANEHDDPQCFSIEVLNKPETEAERVEREREREELSDLTCENLFGESIQNCRKDVADTVRCMIEAGYRKES